jgi:3-oxoacyl-[acyl-carrier-protein] synthase-3
MSSPIRPFLNEANAIISGIGVYCPENIWTNHDLEKLVDTSDEWIRTRTGIEQRHILPKESNWKASDLGAKAAQEALEKAGIGPGDVDGIIAAGINPDKQFPATACFIQQKIGAQGFAFDVTAACAGFVYAVNMASLLIQSGQCKHILVVGAELLSRVVDWEDRNTCVLFGDAAGAVVLSACEEEGRGVLCSTLNSDGAATDILFLNNLHQADSEESKSCLQMNGKQVFKSAVTNLSEVVSQTLDKQNLRAQDLDLAVFHQANVRILDAVAERLGLTEEQLIVNVQRYGNTSSASVPLALYEAESQGKLAPGKLVSLAAIGGGMSWGCNLMRW